LDDDDDNKRSIAVRMGSESEGSIAQTHTAKGIKYFCSRKIVT
jgi:hypothetical protein